MWDIESDALFEGISSNYQVPLEFVSIQIYVDLVRNVIIDLDFRLAYRNFVFTRDNDSKHDWKIIAKIIYSAEGKNSLSSVYIFSLINSGIQQFANLKIIKPTIKTTASWCRSRLVTFSFSRTINPLFIHLCRETSYSSVFKSNRTEILPWLRGRRHLRGETDKKEEKEIRDTLLTSPSSPKVKEIHPPNLRCARRHTSYTEFRQSAKLTRDIFQIVFILNVIDKRNVGRGTRSGNSVSCIIPQSWPQLKRKPFPPDGSSLSQNPVINHRPWHIFSAREYMPTRTNGHGFVRTGLSSSLILYLPAISKKGISFDRIYSHE